MQTRVLRLVKNLVALQPMRRKQSDSGILYDMSRMDDKLQWLVINMSEKAWRSKAGTVQNGNLVIIHANAEHAHEFPDGIVITDANNIIAVVGASVTN